MNDQSLPSGNRLKWLGIGLLILGILAILSPAVAGTWVVIMIGCILLVAGITQVFSGFRAEGFSGKFMPLVLGIITTLAGVAVLGNPYLGLGTLTMLLIVYFVVEGGWKIIASFNYRPAEGWGWLLSSGVISLLLGLMIWNQWPISGLWAVGTLIGVNLLSTGISMIVLSSAVKELVSAVEQQ